MLNNEDFGSNDEDATPLHQEESNATSSAKKRKCRSNVWDHFRMIEERDKAMCKYCEKEFASKVDSGTTHLNNHLGRCVAKKENAQSGSSTNHNFDPVVARKLLGRMIVRHEYPLWMVEHAGFIEYSKYLNPNFDLKTRNTIRSDISKDYEVEKVNIMKMLEKNSSRIAITTDMWNSTKHKKGYMAITTHFIDDTWVLQSRILRFVYVPCPHTGQVLANTLMECLVDWNIDRKLSSLDVDNCSANDRMVNIMLDTIFSSDLICGGKLLHLRCCAHVLNLIVKDGLEVIGEGIVRIRDSVSFWTASPKRIEKFEETARRSNIEYSRKLVLDCKTRWNSTYLMLSTAFIYKEVFSHLKFRDPLYTCWPYEKDWEFVEILIEKLKMFYEVTTRISGTKYPTINEFFSSVCVIQLQITQWLKSDREEIKSMALKMAEKFDKYWDLSHGILAVAIVLDPRYKMKYIDWDFPKIYGDESSKHIDRIRAQCEELVKDYKLKSRFGARIDSCDDNTLATFELGASSSGTVGTEMLEFDLFVSNEVSTESAKSELELYLEAKLSPRTGPFDTLTWWKVHGSSEYPTLAQIARDLLAILVSTVASKSAFSTGGRVLDSHRSKLLPVMVEHLMCTQNWLRGEGVISYDDKDEDALF